MTKKIDRKALADAHGRVSAFREKLKRQRRKSASAHFAYEEARKERERAADFLAALRGARHDKTSCTERLSLAGVSSTATGGTVNLINNWLKAAERRLEGGAS